VGGPAELVEGGLVPGIDLVSCTAVDRWLVLVTSEEANPPPAMHKNVVITRISRRFMPVISVGSAPIRTV
jgi:hypothetical protein